jgi:integrase
MVRWTDLKVKSAPSGKHGVGDGLYLVVSPIGRRSWILRYQVHGKRRDMGLGSYPAVGLADARIAASDARKAIATGNDPIALRQREKKAEKPVPTFEEIAAIVIADAQSKSTNEKVRYQWSQHLGPVYCGKLLKRPVNEITVSEVASTIRVNWHSKPEVSRKLLPAIRRVFNYARVILRDVHGIEMARDPANWTDLKALGFETPKRLSRGSHPALSYTQLPEFMEALREIDTVGAKALEFLILTNVRTGSVLQARWSDIDFDLRIWTVAHETLKDKKYRSEGFRVPLSDPATALLKQLKEHVQSELIFPGQKAIKPLSNMVMLMALRRMNNPESPAWIDKSTQKPITVHGFRATFRTWAEETGTFRWEIIEQSMGHQKASAVERVYIRTDSLDQRRILMDAWGQFSQPRSANVVAFKKN